MANNEGKTEETEGNGGEKKFTPLERFLKETFLAVGELHAGLARAAADAFDDFKKEVVKKVDQDEGNLMAAFANSVVTGHSTFLESASKVSKDLLKDKPPSLGASLSNLVDKHDLTVLRDDPDKLNKFYEELKKLVPDG